MWIIVDWANNWVFKDMFFDTFEDGWEHIYINVSDEEMYQDLYVVPYEEARKTWL